MYGVSLQFHQASRDARSSQDLPTHATEQRSLTYADAGCIVQKPPYFSQSTPTDLPAHATEQRCLTDADAARIVQKPPDFSQSTPAVVASGSQDPPAQRENETRVPILETKQQELAYFIINAFTHELALDDTRAEAVIKAALVDEPCWPHETLEQIDDVFRSVFFEFPNGIRDQTTWTPRDAREIVKQWKEAATFRKYVDTHGSADNKYFAPEQVRCIHHHYVE